MYSFGSSPPLLEKNKEQKKLSHSPRALRKPLHLNLTMIHQKKKKKLTKTRQVFMTRRDILNIFHEPFCDAFYYGPEKISPSWTRWPADKIARTGKGHYTYDLVLQHILDAAEVPSSPSPPLLFSLTQKTPPIHRTDEKQKNRQSRIHTNASSSKTWPNT